MTGLMMLDALFPIWIIPPCQYEIILSTQSHFVMMMAAPAACMLFRMAKWMGAYWGQKWVPIIPPRQCRGGIIGTLGPQNFHRPCGPPRRPQH